MPEIKKNGDAARISSGWSGLYKIALLGAASLKGKELKDLLEERNFPSSEITLLDDEELLGQLEAVGDEPTFIQTVVRSSFEKVDLAFFACDEAFTRKHWRQAQAAGCTIVDLSYALETDAGLAVRSPWMDKELEAQIKPLQFDLETTAVVTADPAAVVLALLMQRAQSTGAVRRAVATVFEPVSEQGKKGMDELHQQTLNLLSFQPLPKEVFDVQVAFNMLQHYGEEAKVRLDATEARILRHFKGITRSRLEMPSLQVLHAPTFHGHTVSLYFEFDRKMSLENFSDALKGEHVTLVGPEEDSPSNVSAAGQEVILVSLRADAGRENGIWVWAAADNLKIAAITATECAAALVASRPSGKIQ